MREEREDSEKERGNGVFVECRGTVGGCGETVGGCGETVDECCLCFEC